MEPVGACAQHWPLSPAVAAVAAFFPGQRPSARLRAVRRVTAVAAGG